MMPGVQLVGRAQQNGSADVTGANGYTMPATQRDLVVWLAGSRPTTIKRTSGSAAT
jgi:hypothetical protein